uniref:Uncharacterized protein n=1 Tax=Rhodopseudomonas palustris (strain DX-1) TaxID=652103 RepID=E6VL73_RHOPX
MNPTSNLCLVDRPQAHDIEAVRPHMRKHLRPWKLLISGSEVTIMGTNPADAKKRFKAMTDGVGFSLVGSPAQGKSAGRRAAH